MRIQALIDSLGTVIEDFPQAEFELGYCDCCIYIVINEKKVAVLNIEEDRFEYIVQYSPALSPDVVDALRTVFNRGKAVE